MSGFCNDCGNHPCVCDDEPVVHMECCACGYERHTEQDISFINSGLLAHYNTPFKISHALISKRVLICPKCGTMKVEL